MGSIRNAWVSQVLRAVKSDKKWASFLRLRFHRLAGPVFDPTRTDGWTRELWRNDFPDPVGWIINTCWPLARFCNVPCLESFKFWNLKESKTRLKLAWKPNPSSPHRLLFDMLIYATTFARRKSAGGNILAETNKGIARVQPVLRGKGWVRAHFLEQRLVIKPTLFSSGDENLGSLKEIVW